MFETLAYIVASGFLARADGWGTDDPRWQRVSKFFNAWSCSFLFAILTMVWCKDPLTGYAAGVAFWLFRGPGFHGWQNWGNMFLRGWWTSARGFAVLSCIVYQHPCFGILSVPFAALYMTTYSGGYAWLPEKILGFNRHVWIEHASAWEFSAFVLIIIGGYHV